MFTLTLGTRWHEKPGYATLYHALQSAEAHRFINVPIFIYDDLGLVAAVGRNGGFQIYDRCLRQEILQAPQFAHLHLE
jgi:hypothetical protein